MPFSFIRLWMAEADFRKGVLSFFCGGRYTQAFTLYMRDDGVFRLLLLYPLVSSLRRCDGWFLPSE